MKRSLLTILTAVTTWIGAHAPVQAETIVAVTQVSYDAAGRQTCAAVRMNPSVYATGLPADACVLGTTNPTYGPDRITQTVYDSAGQVVQVWQAVGTNNARAYVTYSYSTNGKLIDSIDANGNRTRLAYDSFDRAYALDYPSSTRPSAYNPSTQATALATAGDFSITDYENYGYDANGNRTAWRRRDGQIFYYIYDNLNRQIVKDVPGTSSGDVYTGYDLQGHMLYNRFGSITGSGTQYWYDAFGQMTASTDMNGHSIWKGYRYNNGIATVLVWPDGQGLNTDSRDALNRVKTAKYGSGSLVTYTASYDNLGRMTAIGRQGGSTTWGYDNLGRLQSMTNDLNGTTYDIGWTFAYNPAGQLYTSTASSTTYDYKETVSSSDSPTYDGLNRDARLVGTTAACPSGGYDARQNLICDSRQTPNRTFTYDVENRMLTGVSTSANVRMVYDPEGRLSKYSTDGGSTWYTLVYDGTNLIAYYDNSGAMVARYIHGDGTDNPLIWMVGSDTSNMRPLYTDYHGSVIADTDSAGTLVDLYKYGPYGEPKDISNNEFWGGSAFRYTGQVALPQLQLYYYKARVYDPKWGRFLQTDPIGSKDDLDLYAYVRGDPINAGDSNGTQTVPVEPDLRDPYEDEVGRDEWGRSSRVGSTGGRSGREDSYRGGGVAFWGQASPDEVADAEARNEARDTYDKNCSTNPLVGAYQAQDRATAAGRPTEPYNRALHYGRTPTRADRAAVGVQEGEVADHAPSLVERYYDGDPSTGERPGYQMTPAERAASAQDRSRMQRQSQSDSNSQGGRLAQYSRQKRKEHDL